LEVVAPQSSPTPNKKFSRVAITHFGKPQERIIMKSSMLFSSAITLAVFGTTAISASAQVNAPVYSQGNYQSAPVAQSTAIVVAVPNTIQFELKGDQSYPTTLMLMQPVLDGYGNIVVQANAPVQARVVPAKGGVQILAEALIADGRVIPIQAISSPIPTQSIQRTDIEERADRNSSLGGRLVGSVFGLFSKKNNSNTGQDPSTALEGPDTGNMMKGGLIGNALGLVTGLVSSDRADIANIPQGSVYVLTLQSLLPAIAAAAIAPPPPQQYSSPNQTPQTASAQQGFGSRQPEAPAQNGFRNSLQYSETVERIIAGYRKGDLSTNAARELIESADRFATTQLTQPLYPPAGLRKQVAQLFNFTYAIDR
jgi:hypothetical protein